VPPGRAARGKKKARPSAAGERKLPRAYRKLVRVANDRLAHAQRVVALLTPPRGNRQAVALRTTLEQGMPLVPRVIEQTSRRVFPGQSVPAADKGGSVVEPRTAIIRRGKVPPRDTAFGRQVWYSAVGGGLVSE
jgi:hypothetical protein